MSGKTIAAIIATAILLCACFGCYTNSKATKQVQKAIDKKPVLAAKLTRAAFPCITKKSDTTDTYTDTPIAFDCPPDTVRVSVPMYLDNGDGYFTLHDTVIVTKPRTITKEVPAHTQYIETFIEDSAKIKFADSEKAAAVQKFDKQLNEVVRLEKLNKWLWIVLIVIVALQIIKTLITKRV